MAADPLSPLIDNLHGNRLRVWSIVVTIFGDCIQPRGGRAALSELQAITDRLGIEGGALRTAMSRLAQDGWVNRDREGRNSFYTLSDKGKAESEPASRQIYRSRFSVSDKPWVIAISAQPIESAKDMPAFAVTRQVQLIDAEHIAERRAAGDLIVEGRPREIPHWVHAAAIGQSLTGDYTHLADLLEPLNPDAVQTLSPLDALALRVLLIHAWRRIVLRHPAPPEGLTDPSWPGETCHAALAHLYPCLIALSEPWWNPPTGPEGLNALSARFNT